MKFGDKVKEQRIRKGLTQKAAAEALGISTRVLQKYEDGSNYPHNRDVYKRMAELFEIDVNYFLTEDEEFLTEAARRYGRKGLSQAEAILEQAGALFAGGELSDDDKLEFIHEMQEIYFDSKEKAKRFAPKKRVKEQNT